MAETDPYTVVYEDLRQEAQNKLPERCRGCGHFAVGLAHVAADVVEERISREEASHEVDVAVIEVDENCKFGLEESTVLPGHFMCSYDLRDSRNEMYHRRFIDL